MMARYIDADKLLENLETFAPEHCTDLIKMLILKQPTEDVVEVVRCKDCKRFMEYTDEFQRNVEDADGDCYLRIVCSNSLNEQLNAVRYDDYCSYGKRKEGNE